MGNKYVIMQIPVRILSLKLVFIKVALKSRSTVFHAYLIKIRIPYQLVQHFSALISKVQLIAFKLRME